MQACMCQHRLWAPGAVSRGVSECPVQRIGPERSLTATMSVQGNCSMADVGSALSLSSEEEATLSRVLPLKPRQCVVVLQDTFLMVNSGSFWLDNVYLIVLRTRVQPGLALVRTGAHTGEGDSERELMSRMNVSLSNVTMQGASRGWSRGIELSATRSSLLLQGECPMRSAAWPVHACSRVAPCNLHGEARASPATPRNQHTCMCHQEQGL